MENYIEMIETIIPLVTKAADKSGDDIYNLLHRVAMASVTIRADAVKEFEKEGFTREEAIHLTMDEWWGAKKAIYETQRK